MRVLSKELKQKKSQSSTKVSVQGLFLFSVLILILNKRILGKECICRKYELV